MNAWFTKSIISQHHPSRVNISHAFRSCFHAHRRRRRRRRGVKDTAFARRGVQRRLGTHDKDNQTRVVTTHAHYTPSTVPHQFTSSLTHPSARAHRDAGAFTARESPLHAPLDGHIHLILAHLLHRVPIRPRAKRQQRAGDGDVPTLARLVPRAERHRAVTSHSDDVRVLQCVVSDA